MYQGKLTAGSNSRQSYTKMYLERMDERKVRPGDVIEVSVGYE
jgi:hypothetical protein